MEHEMKLRSEYFEKIKSGEKIFEIRLNDEKRQKISLGDDIVFKKEPELKEELKTKVKDLIVFESFEEMASLLPLRKVGFDGFSGKEVVEVYHQFYSENDEKKFGVLAIRVEVQKDLGFSKIHATSHEEYYQKCNKEQREFLDKLSREIDESLKDIGEQE